MSTDKIRYLNVGCGSKFHKSWYNIDMVSRSPEVQACNLFKGIPFPDDYFDVVYHSQVLEHFPRERAHSFIRECNRVLKKDGAIRIVVPDLENIAEEYLRLLKQNTSAPDEKSEADYEWIMLEMYDQTVRNYTGGDMAAYLLKDNIPDEDYVKGRLGLMWNKIRANTLKLDAKSPGSTSKPAASASFLSRVKKKFLVTLFGEHFYYLYKLGSFRMEGEIHMWMYDRYSLGKLLRSAGFKNVEVMTPLTSNIAEWHNYELDVKDGIPYDPKSLFIEAFK